jgi:hypothetical protein
VVGAPAGDDFVRQFRVDAGNLFANGHFDCDRNDWGLSATAGATAAHDPGEDADGSPESGSVRGEVAFATADPEAVALDQCVDVASGTEIEAQTRYRIVTGPTSQVAVSLECSFFTAPACGSAPLPDPPVNTQVTGTVDWQPLGLAATVPAGGASTRCTLMVQAVAGVTFEAWLDRAILTGPSVIFTDGFESGDTSAWSATVGVAP